MSCGGAGTTARLAPSRALPHVEAPARHPTESHTHIHSDIICELSELVRAHHSAMQALRQRAGWTLSAGLGSALLGRWALADAPDKQLSQGKRVVAVASAVGSVVCRLSTSPVPTSSPVLTYVLTSLPCGVVSCSDLCAQPRQ